MARCGNAFAWFGLRALPNRDRGGSASFYFCFCSPEVSVGVAAGLCGESNLSRIGAILGSTFVIASLKAFR